MKRVTLALAMLATVGLGLGAQSKPAAPSAATKVVVYKSPT
jgi:hypothetical protein